MLSQYVLPGERVEITSMKSLGEGKVKKVYNTNVYDVDSDEEIKLIMPMEQSKIILLPIESEYDLCFYTKKGLYQAYAKVKDRYKSNNIYVVNMELTSSLRKHQRREYYRLNCTLSMKCTCISEQQEIDIREGVVEIIDTDVTMMDGTIVDISGGGVRFISSSKFNVEDRIQFSFSLKDGSRVIPYLLVGRILKSEPLDKKPGEYENRVQFTTIDTESRENIIKYIFEEQRKIRKRTLD